MQKKAQKMKGKLNILIPQTDKKIEEEDQQQEEIYVKPIYSVKNAKKAPVRFNFDLEKMEAGKQRRSKKMDKEKNLLLNSLDVLKFGAISAIAEKQQQIDSLKSQLGWQQVKQLEEQVYQLRQQRKQLKDEISELQEKLQFERQSYTRLLEEKDRVIEELYVQLGSTQYQIEKLQRFEEMKEKKIKIISQENNILFHQLEEEKIAHIKQHVQNAEGYLEDYLQEDCEEARCEEQETKIGLTLQENINVEEIESRHKIEMHELTLFYEKRMAEMREIYEKQLQLWPIQTSKQNSASNELQEDVVSLKQTNAPVPNRLSSELNFKRLSDCYSMTKRELSKVDKGSMQASEKDPFQSNFKFMKRVALTPASQTTSSRKFNDGFKFMAEEKKRTQTEVSDDRRSQRTAKTAKTEREGKKKEDNMSMTSFMFGAIAGGSVALLINSVLRR